MDSLLQVHLTESDGRSERASSTCAVATRGRRDGWGGGNHGRASTQGLGPVLLTLGGGPDCCPARFAAADNSAVSSALPTPRFPLAVHPVSSVTVSDLELPPLGRGVSLAYTSFLRGTASAIRADTTRGPRIVPDQDFLFQPAFLPVYSTRTESDMKVPLILALDRPFRPRPLE